MTKTHRPFIKSIFSLRRGTRLNTLLELNAEAFHRFSLFPWLAFCHFGFGILDIYLIPSIHPFLFIFLRVLTIGFASLVFQILRGRASYEVRVILLTLPFMLNVDIVLIYGNLILNPYFSGLVLVIFTATRMPLKARFSVLTNIFFFAPVFFWVIYSTGGHGIAFVSFLTMTVGSIITCGTISELAYRDLITLFSTKIEREREIRNRRKIIEERVSELVEATNLIETSKLNEAHAAEIQKLSRQVAHDIRSPLAALSTLIAPSSHLNDNLKRLLVLAVNRIRSITNDLIDREEFKTDLIGSKNPIPEAPIRTIRPCQLLSLIEPILFEKQLGPLRDGRIELVFNTAPEAYTYFCQIDPVRLQRTLSNLLNNAAESISGPGKIRLSLANHSSLIILTVEDNGCGISEETQKHLLKSRNFSTKPGGHGLGLSYAKSIIEECDGSLSIDSKNNKGTTVTLRLPEATPPQWFTPSLNITDLSFLLVIDNDTSIHELWKNRLTLPMRNLNPNAQIHFFNSTLSLQTWMKSHEPHNFLLLIDYDLGTGTVNGLDFIIQSKLEKQSILVTTYADRPDIQDKCCESQVKLLSKDLMGRIPLRQPPLLNTSETAGNRPSA